MPTPPPVGLSLAAVDDRSLRGASVAGARLSLDLSDFSGIGSPGGVQVLFTASQGDDGALGNDAFGADNASGGG